MRPQACSFFQDYKAKMRNLGHGGDETAIQVMWVRQKILFTTNGKVFCSLATILTEDAHTKVCNLLTSFWISIFIQLL